MFAKTGEPKKIKSIIESLLIVAAEPLSVAEIQNALGEDSGVSAKEIDQLLRDLKNEYLQEARGYQITEIAGKFQLCTDPQNADWVKRFLQVRSAEGLTKPALETLAIIAYRQPITKLEIEGIRGVNVDGVLKKLMEKGLVRTHGKKEVLGHPFLYVTTEKFLEHFGLRSLDDLPQKEELQISKPTPERIRREPEQAAKEN